ncbi:hypothetical protein [Hymenobacter sp. APR13]|uniref:hypothetical protein n=1 Tax=Hymenobacter sp. APR13 TaxID=1356852 RepID=UPI0004E06005|nr:hypothetical protein [Hymenobacter sp. APR13]AII53216.1 hypothetical protein N008_14680 [Hymenobacter sp. APR13]
MHTQHETQAAYYYSCLYNSLVLLAASPDYLAKLAGPTFDPVFELEAEFDYAFRYPAFEEVFTTGKVSELLKDELLTLKSRVLALPPEAWHWDSISSAVAWQEIRVKADSLLTHLGELRREYDFSFTIHIPSQS